MALRIHEIHPSLVHFPLALFPAALVADFAGRLLGSRRLTTVGATLMPAAAVAGVAAAGSGLVAQGAVQVKGDAHDVLVTHRNLNVGLVLATGLLAGWRSRLARPTNSYLGAGLAGLAALSYTAYLGGKLVYRHGVGVQPASGVAPGQSPQLRSGHMAEALDVSEQHAARAMRHGLHHLKEGAIAPAIGNSQSGA